MFQIETHTYLYSTSHTRQCTCMGIQTEICFQKSKTKETVGGYSHLLGSYWQSVCLRITASHYNIILTMKCNNTCQNPLIIALNLGSMGLLVPNIGGLRRYIQISKYSDIQIFKHSKRSFTFSRPWGREWPRSRQIKGLAILSAPIRLKQCFLQCSCNAL